ncbi:uncharacterized protein LOC107360051 [Tetranychus urticae]|uniref:F-box domain-containing protein n=1 Tax=Tetranychus urticae TaxID=32264 RepID=T1K1V7_TETUR|nr:uncharacterized protein LOC107360051 [Tetranychus urticae]XP_015782157.1 uncharacterized protein LOC107360051 [Tetranychus urticae]
MSINSLPNDCLLIIFDDIKELDDLVNCYKVCTRWSLLIAKRAKRVKYLINNSLYSTPDDGYNEHVYIRTEKPIDGNCLENLFPNLRIVDIDYLLPKKVQLNHILKMVKSAKSLKGFFIELESPFEEVSRCCEDIDMVSVNNILLSKSSPYDGPICENGYRFKQLHIYQFNLREAREFELSFPNLHRLNAYDVDAGGYMKLFDDTVFLRLKIIEFFMVGKCNARFVNLFRFIDHCPVLQSAHISGLFYPLYFNVSKKHESLQDLVIDFAEDERTHWDTLESLMMKYPNLKHLSMRGCPGIKDEHIEKLVEILPNLTLIDVRGSEVTQKAADYCRRHERSIKLYFGDSKEGYRQIKLDWPQISIRRETICRGFDFMKHCFFKNYRSLPCFLDPMDEED